MGKDRPLPTPAVSKAGLKVKTQLRISNWERKQCVPTLPPPYPHTHARTLTPPQVHLSPGRGGGAKARAPGAPQLAGDTRDARDWGVGGLASSQAKLASRAPPRLPAPRPGPPSPPRLHRPAGPRGPLGLPGGRMRSANAAPVGFLLNCTAAAAAAAGRRRRRSGRPAPRAHSPRPAHWPRPVPRRPPAPTRARTGAPTRAPARTRRRDPQARTPRSRRIFC